MKSMGVCDTYISIFQKYVFMYMYTWTLIRRIHKKLVMVALEGKLWEKGKREMVFLVCSVLMSSTHYFQKKIKSALGIFLLYISVWSRKGPNYSFLPSETGNKVATSI